MKTMKLFSMAAAALLMAACSNSDDFDVQKPAETAGVYHFEATIAAPNADASMRTVYTEAGTTINVAWAVGDKIALVHNSVKDVATVTAVDGSGNATIEATITGSPSDDADVYLAYPADAVYSATPSIEYELPFTPNPTTFNKVKNSQDGTLEYIQNNLDLRMGPGKLAVSDDKVTLKGSVSIPSIICIWKLTLQNESSNALSATELRFINNTATQAYATSAAKSEYYLCVVPSFIPYPSGTFSFVATVGSNTYTFSTTGLSLTAGNYYQSTVTMTKAVTTLNNTIKAWTAGSYAVPAGGLTYSDAITVSGDVTLVLTDGETLTLNKGISLASGATLTVQGNGAMVVNGTNENTTSTVAGSTGTLILTSGTLTATGGNGGNTDSNESDVHGGNGGVAINGSVTVSGGTLTATGGNGGSVDFQCSNCSGGNGGDAISGSVTVSGGTLTATGGNGGSVGDYGYEDLGGNGGDAISGTLTGGSTSVNDGSSGSIGAMCDNCTAGTGGKGHN